MSAGDSNGRPPDDWDENTNTSPLSPGLRAAMAGPRPSYIQQVEGPGAPRLLILDRERLVMGRALDADIQFVSSEVSRHHLQIRAIPEGHACEDMGSRNGVYLNGVKIHSASLRDGDTLQLGNVVLIYRKR
jgi:pSer/pThr/pTyr-binding forkhead associated (FHA) protein